MECLISRRAFGRTEPAEKSGESPPAQRPKAEDPLQTFDFLRGDAARAELARRQNPGGE